MIFLSLLLIPLLVAVAAYFFGRGRVTLVELVAHIAAQCAVAGISVWLIYWQNVADHETWNGRVAAKKKEWVSCQHSYKCRCRTVCRSDGKSTSCPTVCDTCYEHSNDWDWAVYTSNGERIEIARVDRRGDSEPARFTTTKIGEPTAQVHSYENFIKAAPDTLFRRHGLVEKFKGRLIPYPQAVYDYYRMDRALVQDDRGAWASALSELNAEIGASKQANVIIVATKEMDQDFAYAMEQHWLGGKKNDIVLIVSVAGDRISWVHVMAWTDAAMFKVKLRDDVMAVGTMDRDKIIHALRENVQRLYVRKPMADFEYLAASITPTASQWLVSILFGLAVSVGLGWYFLNNDVRD